MLTSLVALAVGQTISASASVVYPCFPESPSETPVRMTTHSVTYSLSKARVRCETLSVFKNPTDKPVTLDLSLPIRGKNVQWQQSQGIKFSVAVNRKPVAVKAGQSVRTPATAAQRASGIWAGSLEIPHRTKVTFRPRETVSVSTVFDAPIGRAGLDGLQRMVVYDTSGADNWNGPIGQFNYAIKYTSKLVLQVYTAQPEGKWQIGQNGAFWKQYDFTPEQKPLLIFTYYPGGFDEIGGQ